jgi:hypothetical protein
LGFVFEARRQLISSKFSLFMNFPKRGTGSAFCGGAERVSGDQVLPELIVNAENMS